MFVLRKIESERFELNEILGNKYDLMLKKNYVNLKSVGCSNSVEDLNRWDTIINDCIPDCPLKSEVYGIIYGHETGMYRPLYLDVKYYVMNGEGTTFANLTHEDYYKK